MDHFVISHATLAAVVAGGLAVLAVILVSLGIAFPNAGRNVLAWFVWLVAALVPLGIVTYCHVTELSGRLASAFGFAVSGVFVVVWLVALGLEIQSYDSGTGGPQA